MRITDKLSTQCKKIEPLYFVEIHEGSTIAYLTKNKTSTYEIISTYIDAWLFDNPNTIHNLDILKGLNYNLINFNDIFVPYYIVGISKENNDVEHCIRWTTIGTEDINLSTYIATTNLQTAKEKLEYLKYLKIHELQKQICNICEIEICVPPVGN
jgi:hypothetical protein